MKNPLEVATTQKADKALPLTKVLSEQNINILKEQFSMNCISKIDLKRPRVVKPFLTRLPSVKEVSAVPGFPGHYRITTKSGKVGQGSLKFLLPT